jgi:hypothetical protein
MHAVTRRHHLAAAVALALALALAGAACSKQGGASPAAYKDQMADTSAPAADAAASAEAAPASPARGASAGDAFEGLANHNGSQLAYEHDVRVKIAADQIADNLGKVRDACNAQTFGACDVLGEQLAAGDIPSGELRLRAAPAAISGLVKTAADGGSIAQRSTQAEDLAAAVRDNGMRRKRLELQHAKLSEILARGNGKVEDLVDLTERLAAIEAELAQADQEAAQQQRRIATNLLSLHFEAENVSVATVASTKLGEAFRSLTSTWDEVLAMMVRVLLGAFLPFAVVFGAIGWLLVKLLRRARRPAAETTPAPVATAQAAT